MAQFSDTFEVSIVNVIADGTNITAPAALYMALYTDILTDAGVGTEVSGGSYARTAVMAALPTASGTSGTSTSNAAITFPTATASWGTIKSFGLWDATTAGTLYARGVFGDDPWGFTATAADDVLFVPGSDYAVSDQIVVFPIPTRSLPTGLSENTAYYIKTEPSTGSYTISTTDGGATLDITANGAGYLRKLTPQAVANGNTFNVPSGSLKVIVA